MNYLQMVEIMYYKYKNKEYEIGDIIKEHNIDGYNQKLVMTFYGIPFWYCNCSEFKISKPVTPNDCRHCIYE